MSTHHHAPGHPGERSPQGEPGVLRHRAPCADGGACPAPVPHPPKHTLPAQCSWGRTLTCSQGCEQLQTLEQGLCNHPQSCPTPSPGAGSLGLTRS